MSPLLHIQADSWLTSSVAKTPSVFINTRLINYHFSIIRPIFNVRYILHHISLVLQETNFREPVRDLTEDEMSEMELKYYHPGIHRASFVHPQFVKKVINN